MTDKKPASPSLMEKIVALCKRRGFIFPSSEIYGGINGFWDYGPLGAELKKNIRDCWWNDMVRGRDDVVGIETSIIMHPKVWEASGHVGGFTDPLVDCKETKQRYRADQLFIFKAVARVHTPGEASPVQNIELGFVAVAEDEPDAMVVEALKRAKVLADIKSVRAKDVALIGDPGKPVRPKPFEEATPAEQTATLAPSAKENLGTLTEPRAFNMMFETNVGALREESSVAYLRPETAQGMFADFKAVLDTGRVKIPFGIAQIGKSFRNEITPRNFIFRSREFEQMEMEFFISDDDDWAKWHRYWIDWCHNWLLSIGLPASHLSEYNHAKEKLAFYSKGTTDLMFRYPFGVQELWGIAARGCYDLSQHAQFSGTSMEYFDEEKKRKYVPHVIEPAVGVDRIMLAILCSAYAEETTIDEKGQTETRVVMRFAPRVAPIKVAVFPLLRNKPPLVEKAREVYKQLQPHFTTEWDDRGNIGKRYRYQDEQGTPWCVTIDFETLGEKGPELQDTVTFRDRDTMKQERVKIADLIPLISQKLRSSS